MDRVFVLDKELDFGRALCLRMQGHFPHIAWTAYDSLKNLYRALPLLPAPPRLLVYTPEHFPNWRATWPCEQLLLRENALYEDLYKVRPGILDDLALSGEADGERGSRIYRLNSLGIEQALRALLDAQQPPRAAQSGPGLVRARVRVLVADVGRAELEGYLHGLCREAAAQGLRSLLVALSGGGRGRGPRLLGPDGRDGADLPSLLDRLRGAALGPEQLWPYFYPSLIPSALALAPGGDDWRFTNAAREELRRLILLIKRAMLASRRGETCLLLCEKDNADLLRCVLPISDGLILLDHAEILNTAAGSRANAEIKAMLPPGFPIAERCLPRGAAPAPRRAHAQ